MSMFTAMIRKLHFEGVGTLSDIELLALFLAGGDPVHRPDALLEATRFIGPFGGLRGLLEAAKDGDANDTITAPDLARFKVLGELARRYFAQSLGPGTRVDSPERVSEFLRGRLLDRDRESFGCLFVDARHRALAFEVLALGTIDGAVVYPREVVRATLRHAAQAVIVAHNHPSDSATPSAVDRAITTRLKAALELIDVALLDHVIVTRTQCVSMAGLGIL
ncbi:MAG: DNA repair protein RadC [Pseudomonadota bacterium]